MNKNLRSLQLLQLDCLIEIDKICKRYNLDYFMIGGTLLGAVRHKGFIPWDDDIDIAMPRDSYEKLIELCKNGQISNDFNIQSFKFNDDMKCYFTRAFASEEKRKEVGFSANSELGLVLIDILPIDGTPNNKLIRKIYYLRVMIQRTLAGISNLGIKSIDKNRSKLEKNILKLAKFLKLYKLLNRKKIYYKLDKIYMQNSWTNKYSGTITGAYKTKEIVKSEYWGKGANYQFEGRYFRGPELYDEYLTHMYGDYMKLPDEKDRKSHFTAEFRGE